MHHWKYWLPFSSATNAKTIYTKEAASLVTNLKADFPKYIAYIVIHNRTVNVDGKQGHGKLIDQMIEHYWFRKCGRGLHNSAFSLPHVRVTICVSSAIVLVSI